jgi:hypothetical protein
MKKLALLGGSLLGAAALAISALAGDYESGRGMMKGGGMMGTKGDCMMDARGMHGECPMAGSHSMTGKVDKIDHAKGTLTLKHGAADMLLHFPPAAVKDLKNGDTITVHLGFSKETAK